MMGEKWRTFLKSLKKRKAPGLDRILNEMMYVEGGC